MWLQIISENLVYAQLVVGGLLLQELCFCVDMDRGLFLFMRYPLLSSGGLHCLLCYLVGSYLFIVRTSFAILCLIDSVQNPSNLDDPIVVASSLILDSAPLWGISAPGPSKIIIGFVARFYNHAIPQGSYIIVLQ